MNDENINTNMKRSNGQPTTLHGEMEVNFSRDALRQGLESDVDATDSENLIV